MIIKFPYTEVLLHKDGEIISVVSPGKYSIKELRIKHGKCVLSRAITWKNVNITVELFNEIKEVLENE